MTLFDRHPARFLFVLFTSFFFLCGQHLINGSNDGAYVGMIRSWQKGSLYYTDQTFPYAGGVSFAEVDGRQLSDRNIGMALMNTPLWVLLQPVALTLGLRFSAPDIEYMAPAEHADKEDVFPSLSLLGVVMHLLPAAFGGGAVALFFSLLRMRGGSLAVSAFTAAGFTLGTCMLPFAQTIFIHGASVFFTLLVLYYYYRVKDHGTQEYVKLGAVLGFLALIEYMLVIFGAGILLMLACRQSVFGASPEERRKHIIRFALAGAAPVLLFMAYNTVALGSPLASTYSKHGFYLYTHTLSGLLSGDIGQGLEGLLVRHYRHGLLITAPALLFGFAAIAAAFRRREREPLILAVIIAAHWLFIAKTLEWHGASFYPRYILWSGMLLALLAGYWFVDNMNAWQRERGRLRASWLSLFVVLMGYGLWKSFSYNQPPGQSKQVLMQQSDLLNFFYDMGLHGMRDWPVLVWFFCVLMLPKAAGFSPKLRKWALAGVLLLPFLYAYQNPWLPRREKLAVLDAACLAPKDCGWRLSNENFAMGPVNFPDGSTITYKDNIDISGGIAYPRKADKPAIMRYNLDHLLDKNRRRVKVDFTLTSKTANRVIVRACYASGECKEVLSRHSDGIERRYAFLMSLADLPKPETLAALEFELYVDGQSVANVDSRIHAIYIY